MKKINAFLFLLPFIISSCNNAGKTAERVLPIYGEREVNQTTVNGKEVVDTIFHVAPPFRYLNQDSTWIDQNLIKDKVYIVDFFFTSCPTICPKMTSQLKRVQAKTKDISNLYHIFSFSIDPERDTPQKLRAYIQKNGLIMNNWDMLTGDEAATHKLGVEGFIVHAGRDEDAQGGFAHSASLVLVDRAGLIRGIYNGTETADVDRLEKDLRKLLKVEYGENIGE
ncbi:MAG: SCO family protein [Crocinitomicaceae bacterium]